MANPNHPAAPYQGGEGSPPAPRAPAPAHYAGGADAMEELAARVSQFLKLDDITDGPRLFSAGSVYNLMLQPQPQSRAEQRHHLPPGAEQHRLLPPRSEQRRLLPQGPPIDLQHYFIRPRPQRAPMEQHYFLAPRPRYIDSPTRGASSRRNARPISPSPPHDASGSNLSAQDSRGDRQGRALQLEEMRQKLPEVLARVKLDLHKVMETEQGSSEFGMLLECCQGNYNHLRGLVQSFAERSKPVWGRWLMRRPADDKGYIWLASVHYLFKAVAQYPDLCRQILECLLQENVMFNPIGPEVLELCFSTMPYQETKVLIEHAVSDIEKNLHRSQFGSLCLAKCSTYAKGDEAENLEESIFSSLRDMCLGKYSNYLVQHVIEHGSDEFLCSVLSWFSHLEVAELAELVNGESSNFAIQKLLHTGSKHLPATTRTLAQVIQQLPAVVLRHPYARLVTRIVREILNP